MTDTYWERQSGGLCRKHALNAYFGSAKISDADFHKLCLEFDKYIKSKGYPYSQIAKFDCIYSSQETVVSYIVGKYDKRYCLHIPIGKYDEYLKQRGMPLMDIVANDTFVFTYNMNHIYGYKLVDGQWYLIDSLRGVHKSALPLDRKLGYIIPRWSPWEDLRYNQERMKKIIDEGLEEYLEIQDTLGEVEILMATSADMIGHLGDFAALREYYSFLRRFEKSPLEYDRGKVAELVKFFVRYE